MKDIIKLALRNLKEHKSKTLIIDSESQDTSFQTSMPEKKIQIEEKSDLNNNNVLVI